MLQTPLHTSFGPAATAAEVARLSDLAGKIAIVTGGSSGLGLETVKALSSRGATVVVPALDVSQARIALDGIEWVKFILSISPTSIRSGHLHRISSNIGNVLTFSRSMRA